MLRLLYVCALLLILNVGLYACQSPNDMTKHHHQNNSDQRNEALDNTNNKSLDTDKENQNSTQPSSDKKETTDISLDTGITETETRTIEGMEEEVEIINYQIQPHHIAYQLSDSFKEPKVENNKITYKYQDTHVTLEVIKDTNLEETVSNLQNTFNSKNFEDQTELESTPSEENHLKGKEQHFVHPDMEGFYVYKVGEQIVAITYHFPTEAADGMFPVLESLGESIHMEI